MILVLILYSEAHVCRCYCIHNFVIRPHFDQMNNQRIKLIHIFMEGCETLFVRERSLNFN